MDAEATASCSVNSHAPGVNGPSAVSVVAMVRKGSPSRTRVTILLIGDYLTVRAQVGGARSAPPTRQHQYTLLSRTGYSRSSSAASPRSQSNAVSSSVAWTIDVTSFMPGVLRNANRELGSQE